MLSYFSNHFYRKAFIGTGTFALGIILLKNYFCINFQTLINKKENLDQEKEDFSNSKEKNKDEENKENEKIDYSKIFELNLNRSDILHLESELNIEKNQVSEKLNNEEVILKYSESMERFEYWSKKSKPYPFLEHLARKWVILNERKELYLNMEDELNKTKDKIEKKLIQDNNNSNITQTAIFAKFKLPENQNNNKRKLQIANENGNIYKWMGTLFPVINDSDNSMTSTKDLNYKKFKNSK